MSKNHVDVASCSGEHPAHTHHPRSVKIIQRTAALFNALGDSARLRLMELLFDGPHCVSELAQETTESMSLISQRLKILYQAGLVTRQRTGKHIYYSLADEHVITLLDNAFKHIEEH